MKTRDDYSFPDDATEEEVQSFLDKVNGILPEPEEIDQFKLLADSLDDTNKNVADAMRAMSVTVESLINAINVLGNITVNVPEPTPQPLTTQLVVNRDERGLIQTIDLVRDYSI